MALHLSAAPATPALSVTQLNEAIRSGLNTIVTQAFASGELKVALPSLLKKAQADLVKEKKDASLIAFNKAMEETVSKLRPQAADLLNKAIRDLKFDDPKAILSDSPDGCTDFLRKNVESSVREALLPLVKKATAATDLATKAKAVLNTMNPNGVKGGAMMIVGLDDHVCKQVIAESFKLIAQKEKAVRANPALLTGNTLAQKAFTEYKK